MFDRWLLPIATAVLDRPARALVRAGVAADAITLAGLATGLAAAGLAALGAFHLALLAFATNRLLDGLDGAVARLSASTDRGAFLDIAFDFFVYAALPLGFAVANPAANALPAAALLVAFMGTASSFLAFAVIAERRGMTSTAYPRKGLYYLGGMTEGSETIACFAAMLLWPWLFAPLAWGFAALCFVTTMSRWIWGFRLFGRQR